MITHTHTHTHTLHTCCSWVLDACIFLSAVFRWRKPVTAEGSPPLWDRWLRGKLPLGKEKSKSGVVHFSFGQAKYNVGICIYAEDAKQLIICTKRWQVLMVVHCEAHPCKGGWGYAPLPPRGIVLEFRIWECIYTQWKGARVTGSSTVVPIHFHVSAFCTIAHCICAFEHGKFFLW